MSETLRARLVAYGVAVLATVGTLLARGLLFPLLGYRGPLLTFFPAVLLSAYLGGGGPGLLATVLGAAAADCFLVEARGPFGVPDGAGADALGLFVLAGAAVSGLAESLRRCRHRATAREACRDARQGRQAEEAEAFRQANERMELAVRGSKVGVWEIEMHDGDIARARRHYVNIWEQLGYTCPQACAGVALAEAHPDDRARVEELQRGYLAGAVAEYETEIRFRHRDGFYLTMLTRAAAVRDASGKPVRLVGIAMDVTKLKLAEEALRESEGRFRGTFENAAVGIAHTDLDGRWLRVNERFGAILGYTAEEVLRLSWQEVTYPEDLPASAQRVAALLQGERRSYSMEKRYVRKDGSVIWTQVAVSLQRDAAGRPAYAITVLQDISQRKRLEGELRQAKEAAESANRAKDEFLANVSHEIRTPMNAILGMTELALETELTEDQRQCLKTVKSAADNLLGLINDLLDVAKIEAGKMELDPVDFSLRSAVGDTLRALALRAHGKGLALICRVQPDVPDALVGDAGRLRQVLLNLVGNAIKFTEEGEVVVAVEAVSPHPPTPSPTRGGLEPDHRRADAAPLASGFSPPSPLVGEGGWGCEGVDLRFEVRDTGIGIPADKQERIFRPFEQEDTSTTRKYGGTGLGLTIASRLVALMGGRITVDSAPGRGSTFAFTVRFARQSQPTGPAADLAHLLKPAQEDEVPATTRQGLQKDEGGRRKDEKETNLSSDSSFLLPPSSFPLRILVAEDNEFNAQLLEQLLRRRGHEVRVAHDGREALALAGQGGFDLLVLDVHMPELDGFEVARGVRERERAAGGHLPIIALTARARREDRERGIAAGMDDFLTKPVQAPDLWAAMARLVGAEASAERPGPGLLDPRVILAACGDDAAILEKIGRAFRCRLPDCVKAVQDALRNGDAHRLREAAHKVAGMVATFSSVAGGVASELEDRAAQGQLDAAPPLVARLDTMAAELLRQVDGLSIEALRRQAGMVGAT